MWISKLFFSGDRFTRKSVCELLLTQTVISGYCLDGDSD